jgi:hypothetical protein
MDTRVSNSGKKNKTDKTMQQTAGHPATLRWSVMGSLHRLFAGLYSSPRFVRAALLQVC